MASIDPPGPLFFLPNKLAPWRAQNRRRRDKENPDAPPPSRLQLRMEAKIKEGDEKTSQPTLPRAAAETLNPVGEDSEPAPEEALEASTSLPGKKSLAERARDKKASKASAEPKEGIVIGIMDLKILKSMTTSVATYNVFTPKLGHSVWRKHADFVWLRSLLKARYEGMLIPSIPPKLLGSATLALCEPRKRLLTQFLARLGFDDLLRQDPAVFAFISIADDSAWAKYVKETDPNSGAGAAWVEKCVSMAPAVHTEADATIAEYRARFAAHEKHLAKLDAAASAVAAASRALNKAVKKCGGVATVYADDAEGLSGDAAKKVRGSIGAMAGAFTAWARDSALGPAVLNEVLKTGVTYELQQVHAFNELLAAREAKVAELDKCKKKKDKHDADKAGGKTETKGSRFPGGTKKKPLDDAIAAAASAAHDAEDEVACATGALLGSEFRKFDDELHEAFSALVGMVSVGMLKVQDHGTEAWTKALEGADAARMTNKIKAVIPEFDDYGAVADGKADLDEEDGLGKADA